MPATEVDTAREITALRQKIDAAKVKLGVQKDARTKMMAELRKAKVTNVDQARVRIVELKKEAEKLDSEAAVLLTRARKLLERFE